MDAEQPYSYLMEQLGYPTSERLRAIMKNLMTPRQAQIAAALPGTAAEVAEKTGFDEAGIQQELETLFKLGAAFPRGDYAKREYFRFARHMGQFHDCTQATSLRDVDNDKEFYRLWHDFVMNEWYPDRGEQMKKAPRPGSRIVAAWSSIKDLPGVLPEDSFPEILKAQAKIAVVPCSCRYRTTSVDEHCDCVSEEERWNCIQFARSADYVEARDSGKVLTTEEALALNDDMEAEGLLHIWPNHATMQGVGTSCQCCRDCCMTYVPIDMVGTTIHKVWEKSRFQAEVEEDKCSGCQDCVERCQFDAIEMIKPEGARGRKSKKLKASIIDDNCWGCGVCVAACDEDDALHMKEVRPPDFIPGIAAG